MQEYTDKHQMFLDRNQVKLKAAQKTYDDAMAVWEKAWEEAMGAWTAHKRKLEEQYNIQIEPEDSGDHWIDIPRNLVPVHQPGAPLIPVPEGDDGMMPDTPGKTLARPEEMYDSDLSEEQFIAEDNEPGGLSAAAWFVRD